MSGMIVFDERFSAERDVYGWHLTEKRPGLSREGCAIVSDKVTHHARLEHVCERIIDFYAGEANGGPEEVIKAIQLASNDIKAVILMSC